LWDVTTGDTVSILEGYTNTALSLSFSGDGRVLASNSADGTVRLWETETGRCMAALPVFATAFADLIEGAAFHPH
jgi:hypothetical protein